MKIVELLTIDKEALLDIGDLYPGCYYCDKILAVDDEVYVDTIEMCFICKDCYEKER